MAKSVDAVVADALQLTAEERARVADKLLASLSEDPDIEQAWATEVERRLAEIESGRARLVPAADAVARARAALK
jgi:putative addiction module component (TIGR02574 family)